MKKQVQNLDEFIDELVDDIMDNIYFDDINETIFKLEYFEQGSPMYDIKRQETLQIVKDKLKDVTLLNLKQETDDNKQVKTMKEYRYFVSCNMNTPSLSGFLTHEIRRTKPISNINDIVSIASMIEKEMGYPKNSVCVTNFRLFEE